MDSGTRRPSRPSRPDPGLVLDTVVGHLHRLRRRSLQLRSTGLGRRVVRRRVVALLLAVVTTLTVSRTVTAARTAVDRWGPTAPVVVATALLPAGSELGPSTVRVEQWPTRLVPQGALTAVDGRRTERTVAAGAPVTATDLAGAGRGAVASRLPDRTVGVTVPRGPAPAPVRPGDRVDVLGATADGRSLGAQQVAARATVVAVDRVTVTVAVRRSESEDVAAAAAAGTAVLVLVP